MKRRNRQNQYRSSISTFNQKGTGKGEGILLKIILWFIDIFSPEERCWWSSPALLCGPRTAPLKHEETLERKMICRLYKMTPENKLGCFEVQSDQWRKTRRWLRIRPTWHELSHYMYFLVFQWRRHVLLIIKSFQFFCSALTVLVLETLTEIRIKK
jgi:hypothetical protein